METITVGSAKTDGPGRFQRMLKVGSMPDGAPIELPVIIVRGAQDGPVLWLHGCVHGNEYCGTHAIHEFTRSLDAALVTGTIIALPFAKVPPPQHFPP